MLANLIEQKMIEENRDRKISSIINDEPLVPYTFDMAIEELVAEFAAAISSDRERYKKSINYKYFFGINYNFGIKQV